MYEVKRTGIEALSAWPEVDEAAVDRLLNAEIAGNHMKIVVLDDDPTGVQTVHDVSVYTEWSRESIAAGFAEENRLFYVLTNSRGFTVEQTTQAHREIARTVAGVSRTLGRDYLLISRSDSTLRGHYPLETMLLQEETVKAGGPAADGEILCPFFKEGGRYTLGNVHYVQGGRCGLHCPGGSAGAGL